MLPTYMYVIGAVLLALAVIAYFSFGSKIAAVLKTVPVAISFFDAIHSRVDEVIGHIKQLAGSHLKVLDTTQAVHQTTVDLSGKLNSLEDKIAQLVHSALETQLQQALERILHGMDFQRDVIVNMVKAEMQKILSTHPLLAEVEKAIEPALVATGKSLIPDVTLADPGKAVDNDKGGPVGYVAGQTTPDPDVSLLTKAEQPEAK